MRQVHRASEQWMRLALRQSEERYRVLAELSPVGIFHADAAGSYLYVNRRWCEIAGLAQEEAVGDGWARGLDSADRVRVLGEWRAAVAADQGFAAEYRFRRGDGALAWVFGQARPQENGNGSPAGYVGTITDITERRKTEESLRLLEAALEQALLPVAVTSTDAEDRRFVYVNPAFARMTGYSEAELLGKSPAILHGLKTGRSTVERMDEALRQGRSFVGDMINYRKDGSTFAIEWRLDPVRDAHGHITHWVAIFR